MDLQHELKALIRKYGEEKVLAALAEHVDAQVTYTYEDLDAVYSAWKKEAPGK